ncbi:MAG: hypothetical protein N2Z74_04065 [Syntrophales bacterium]|nr:hypothetical protein [Syntrophales bacterium]
MNNVKGIAVLTFVVLTFAACAMGPKPPPPSPGSLEAMFRTDGALFRAGCESLGTEAKPADLDQARSAFATLIQRYPKSKWRTQAETYIMLIDALLDARKKGEEISRQVAARDEEIRNMREELEQGKRENRQLKERLSELGRLQQENDQLRKDLEQLKKLEIELLQRERRLR